MIHELIFLPVLILLNAFFAASETALISLNDNKIRLMVEKGSQQAKLIQRLLNEPGRFLATMQTGITISGFLASAFAAVKFSDRLVDSVQLMNWPIPGEWLKNLAVIAIALVLAFGVVVFGSLIPKRLASNNAESASLILVNLLWVMVLVLSPFVALFHATANLFLKMFGVDPQQNNEQVTEEEIRMMVDVGEEKGTIHSSEKEMINNVFEFDKKTVADIMTHRTDIVALPVTASIEDAISVINEEKYTRLPIYQHDIDTIVGILHAKDLIQFVGNICDGRSPNLNQLMRRAYYVPASKRTDELFKELQKHKLHMAVIIDEYGGTAGIATVEDLVEEIMGSIFDEYDEDEKELERIDANCYLANGSLSLDILKDIVDIDVPVEDYETLSGFFIGQLGRIPEPSERPIVEYEGWRFQAVSVEEKRIAQIKISRHAKILFDDKGV